jgi:hypothetical protein
LQHGVVAEHLLALPTPAADRALVTTQALGNGAAAPQPDQQIKGVELLNQDHRRVRTTTIVQNPAAPVAMAIRISGFPAWR